MLAALVGLTAPVLCLAASPKNVMYIVIGALATSWRCALCAACTSSSPRATQPRCRHDLLRIQVARNALPLADDLRPELGNYGADGMLTPNLDQLAKESLVFDRAYVQVALCGPSRNSFMTGRRPDVTRTYTFADHFREKGVGDEWQTLPQIFKAHGHLAFGVGKLYHPNLPPNYDGDNSWSPQVIGATNSTLLFSFRSHSWPHFFGEIWRARLGLS